MRIEIADHAANRILEQLGVVDVFDVISFDASDDLGDVLGRWSNCCIQKSMQLYK